MRLSPWSLLLLLLLILCSLWPPGPCLPTWSSFDTQAPKRKGSTRLKTDKGTQGGRQGDTLCPSQCRLQKKGTLGCFRAEHVDLHQLARCLLSLPAVEVVELVSPNFRCNCTLIHFVVLTSSAHTVTLTLPSTCSALILRHCGSMVQRIRSRRKRTPRSPGAGLRDRHLILSSHAPPLPQILWHRQPASALSAIVVRTDHQQLDWLNTLRVTQSMLSDSLIPPGNHCQIATARKKEHRARESASHRHSLHGYTFQEPGYTSIYLHKSQPAAVTLKTLVKSHDTRNIGKRTLDTTRKESYPANTHRLNRRHTTKRNFDVKEIFDKHFDFKEEFDNSIYIPSRTYVNDTVLNNITKFDTGNPFEGRRNHKGFRYLNSQRSILSAYKTANLIISTIQPHQILYKTKIKAGGYVEAQNKAAKEKAQHNSWSNSLYIESSDNKKPTMTHTSGDHNRTRRNARLKKRRIPDKASRKGKQIKGREVTISRKNFKKQRNNLEITDFFSGIPIDNSGIFGAGTGKGTRNVAKKLTVPLNMNLETNRHVEVYKQFEKPAHERQYITKVLKPVTDSGDENVHKVMQNIHKTPQFHMPTDKNNLVKREDAGQLWRSKRTATHKTIRKSRIKRKQKRNDDEDAGNENNSENIAKVTEYKERYAREADEEEEEEEEEDSDDDDGDNESDSDDSTKDKMPEDEDEQEAEDADDNKGADPEADINRQKHDINTETSSEVQETLTIIESTENVIETNDQEQKKKDTNSKVNANKLAKHSLDFNLPKTSRKIEDDKNNKTDINTKVYANNHDIRGFLFDLPVKLEDTDPLKPLKRKSTQASIDNGKQTNENWEKSLRPYSDDEMLFFLGSLQKVHQFSASPNEENDLPFIRDKERYVLRRPSLDLDDDAQADSALGKWDFKRSAPTRKRDKKGAKKKEKKEDKKGAKKKEKKDDKKGAKQAAKKDAKKEGKKKDKAGEKKETDITVEQRKKGAVVNIKEKSSNKKKDSKKGSKAKEEEEEEDEDEEDLEGGEHQSGFSKAVTAMTDLASSLGGILMILTIVCFCFCCRKKQTPRKREEVGLVGKLLRLAGLVKPTEDKEKLLAKDTSLTKTEDKAKAVVQEEKPTLLSAIEPAAPTPPQPSEETYKQTSEHQDFLKRLTKQRLSIFQAPVEEDEAESEQAEPAAQPSPQAAQPMPNSPATSKSATVTATSSASSPSATTTSESETTDSEGKKAKASTKKKADDKKKPDKKKPDKKKPDKKKPDKKKPDKKKPDKKKSNKKDSGKEEADKKKKKAKSKKK